MDAPDGGNLFLGEAQDLGARLGRRAIASTSTPHSLRLAQGMLRSE